MSATSHTIDHSTNTLYMLQGDRSSLNSNSPVLITTTSITGHDQSRAMSVKLRTTIRQ
jgi:hypothetical protein